MALGGEALPLKVMPIAEEPAHAAPSLVGPEIMASGGCGLLGACTRAALLGLRPGLLRCLIMQDMESDSCVCSRAPEQLLPRVTAGNLGLGRV